MIVRALDENGDWTFGKGKNDYRAENNAVRQIIQTRLSSFLGDCFFAIDEGIDWFNLLGAKNQIALNLAINAVILNTIDVVAIRQLSAVLNPLTREFTVAYDVQTVYSTINLLGGFSVNIEDLI